MISRGKASRRCGRGPNPQRRRPKHLAGGSGILGSGSIPGEADMAHAIRMSLNQPEETRPFKDGKGAGAIVNSAAGAVGRAPFEPGWKWNQRRKPMVGTDSCQAASLGYYVSGRMKGRSDHGR